MSYYDNPQLIWDNWVRNRNMLLAAQQKATEANRSDLVEQMGNQLMETWALAKEEIMTAYFIRELGIITSGEIAEGPK